MSKLFPKQYLILPLSKTTHLIPENPPDAGRDRIAQVKLQLETCDRCREEKGYWYAGAIWRNQALGSTNLSEVTLSAMVNGTWNPSWLQGPATYLLRIEDPEGDWIGIDQVYDATNQSIGGALSGYTVSGLADGSNGVFDIDTGLDYSVVVMFVGEGPPVSSFGNQGE